MADQERIRGEGERPSLDRRQEKLDDTKRRYKEQCEQTGREVSSRELDRVCNGIAEKTDRENGW